MKLAYPVIMSARKNLIHPVILSVSEESCVDVIDPSLHFVPFRMTKRGVSCCVQDDKEGCVRSG